MKKIVIGLGLMVLIAFVIGGCTVDVAELKEAGPKYFTDIGYKVLAYEGYQWGIWGGKVWFLVEDTTRGLRYSHYLIKRGGEIHWYYGNDHQKAIIQQVK